MNDFKLLYNKNKSKAQAIPSINPIIAEILINRGFKTEKDIKDFIEKKQDVDYGEMKGIKKASEIIGEAIRNNETMVLYTDTDVDGCMSAAVGMTLLRKVTDKVYYYSNDKFRDGYGLCKTGIDNILISHPDVTLIITADNGVAATDIAYAKEKGLKVVVTDHHEPPSTLPPADVIVDPKQLDCPYKFKELCGAGVLYKVLKETYKYLNKNTEEADTVLDLVAFATVGDVVPLIKENRIIVDKGIEMINKYPSPTFKTIMEVLELKEINSHNTIAYYLSPMVNALSRMTGSIEKGIKLFLTDDKDERIEIINFMKEKNEERKAITEKVLNECKELLNIPLKEKIIVVSGSDFHEGVVGNVAGKLKEEFNRPVIVLSAVEEDDSLIRGSARSTDKFPLKDMFDNIQKKHHIFESYGGHAKAAGLTIKKENLEKLKELLNIEADKVLTEEDLLRNVIIDAAVTNKELSVELVESIENLGPFGEGFPEPLIAINFSYTDIYKMGKEKQHVKFLDKFTDTSVIIWDGSKILEKIKNFKKKAIGNLSVNNYNNKKTVQLIVNDELLF